MFTKAWVLTIRFTVAFLCLQLMATLGKAQVIDTANSKPLMYKFAIDSQIAYLEDACDTISAKRVFKGPLKDQFTPNTTQSPCNFGYSTSAYWLAFQLENGGKKPLDLVVEINNPSLDSIWFNVVSKDTLLESKRGGRYFSSTQSEVQFRNPAFNITIPPGKYREVFIKVIGKQQLRLPIMVYSKAAFAAYKDKSNLIFSLFYAVLLIILIHNLFLFFANKDVTYLLFLLANALLILVSVNINGFPFQYSEMRWLRFDSITVPYLLMVYSFLMFTIGYLRLRRLTKLPYYIVIGFATILPLVGTVLYYRKVPLLSLQQPISIAVLAVCIVAAVYSLQKRYHPAWYFLSGLWVITLGGACYLLGFKGTFHNSFWMEYSLQLGIVAGVALLSMGLSERQVILNKEKHQAPPWAGFLSGMTEFMQDDNEAADNP